MKSARSRAAHLITVSAFLFACANSAESKVHSEVASSSQGFSKEESSFVVTATVPQSVTTGSMAKVRVTVKSKPGWKLNQDFPTKLVVEAPAGVTLVKAVQRKGDAVHFSEKKGEFDVSFTTSGKGDKKFAGTFKFAVCTDKSCDPKKVPLAWVVTVE